MQVSQNDLDMPPLDDVSSVRPLRLHFSELKRTEDVIYGLVGGCGWRKVGMAVKFSHGQFTYLLLTLGLSRKWSIFP